MAPQPHIGLITHHHVELLEPFWAQLDHRVAELVQLALAELVGDFSRELGPPA